MAKRSPSPRAPLSTHVEPGPGPAKAASLEIDAAVTPGEGFRIRVVGQSTALTGEIGLGAGAVDADSAPSRDD